MSAETTSVSSLMGSRCHSSLHWSSNLRTPESPSIKGPLFYRPRASWGETCLRTGTRWHPKPLPQAFSLMAPAFSSTTLLKCWLRAKTTNQGWRWAPRHWAPSSSLSGGRAAPDRPFRAWRVRPPVLLLCSEGINNKTRVLGLPVHYHLFLLQGWDLEANHPSQVRPEVSGH